jgi:HEAT repeat protein
VALANAGDPACTPGLSKLLLNTKAHPQARAAAAVALGSIDADDARKALAAVAKDDNPVASVRAAAMLALIKPNAGRGKVIAMEKYLRDPSAEMRAAAAAGVVRAGGASNLDDLYVLFKDNDPRPSIAALKELERVSSEKATELIARLAKRPHLEVQKLAAELLLKRAARDYYASLKSFLEPKADPMLRTVALAGVDEASLQAASADPTLGTGIFRARLARGEREQAIDWFLAHGAKLPAAAQADAMADWIVMARQTPPAPENKTTASKTPGR